MSAAYANGDPAPAVVLGLSPTGLYVVRELGRAGVPVLGASESWGPAAASRYVTLGTLVEPDEARRRDALVERFAGHERKAVLLPSSDQDVEFVARHAEALSEAFVFQASYRDGLADLLMTKAAFYERCVAAGLEPPEGRSAPRDAMDELVEAMPVPCLLKPSRIHDIKAAMRGRKAWIARDREALRELQRTMPPGDYEVVAQEIVGGPESEITLYCALWDRAGTERHAYTARKLRQFPPGFGSASLVVSSDEPDTREQTRRLLGGLGWTGVVASEFKRDPRTGRLRIIEMNPRASLWFAASTGAGRRIALASHAELSGEPVPEPEPDPGPVAWRYATKDAYSAAHYRLKPGFVLPAPDVSAAKTARVRVGALHAPDDPAPARADVAHLARRAFGRLLRRRG